jgi:predicted nucleic acid-binding Zn ribbon protein
MLFTKKNQKRIKIVWGILSILIIVSMVASLTAASLFY